MKVLSLIIPIFILSYSILFNTPLFAQKRGMKPVDVTIDGKTTVLYKQSHALLIGVSDYNMGLPPLPGVTGDIERVKTALESNGFEVTKILNPDATGLQRAFNTFISQYGQGADNRLLIYFAGHGYTEKMPYGEDIGYICPVDAPNPLKDPANFQAKAMPMGQIEIYAKQIKSKHALFLFDACFSGSIFSTSRAIPEIISYKTTQAVRQFITSGSAEETVPDKSIFQSQFNRALNGEADANKDGFVTGTELGDFLQSTVVNYSYGSQHPQYGKIRNPNLDKGDFVFITTHDSDILQSNSLLQPASNLVAESKSSANELDNPKSTSAVKDLKKVTLGIVPDFTNTSGRGLFIDGVKKDGPAEKAGLIKGDVLISINGTVITDIYTYMAKIKDLKFGERVNIEYLRDGKKENLVMQL